MNLINKNGKILFLISVIVSGLFCLTAIGVVIALVIGTKGRAIVFILLIYICYLFIRSASFAHIKGTGLKLSETQLPELYKYLKSCCDKLGIKKVPGELNNMNSFLSSFVIIFLLNNFILIKDSYAYETKLKTPKFSHEDSDLLPDPEVTYGKLQNGFRYALMENNEPKKRVSMNLIIQAGSIYESEKEQGTAHFLEHILFCGSKHYKPGELVKYFQNIGMQFGPDANAHTGFNETAYDIILPEGTKDSIEKALVVMRDFAEGASLIKSEVDRERKIILAEKTARDSASYRTFVSTLKFEIPDTIVSKRLPIGQEKEIKNADRNILKKFYDNYYRPDKMTLVMVGEFDKKIAQSAIEKEFKNLTDRSLNNSEPDLGKIVHNGVKTFYHYEKEIGNTEITIEVMRMIKDQKDSFDLQKKLFSRDAANLMIQYRLNEMLSKKDNPFTAASIGYGIFLKQIESAEINATCKSENWKKTLVLIEQTLRKAILYGFNEQELERVKKDYHNKLDTAFKKVKTRNSRELARQIIHSINSNRVFQSPEQDKILYSPVIDKLTLKDVHESLKEIWNLNHRLILVTGNALLQDKNAILKVYNESSIVKVEKPMEENKVSFPYLTDPNDFGQIKKRKEFSDLGITQIDFANGFRLNLKKTDFKADEVIANLYFGLGQISQPLEYQGLSDLAIEVINESGIGKLTKNDLDRAFAGKNTHLAFGVGEEFFAFNGRTVTKEISLLFQLFYAYLKDISFKTDAFKLTMERFQQKYLALSSSIEGAMELQIENFLAGYDKRFGMPSYEKFNQLKIEQIQSWTIPSIKNDNLELSVIGDFDIEEVIKLASKYFGTIEKRTEPLNNYKSTIPKVPENKTLDITVPTKIPKGIVIIAYPTDDFWDIHRTRCLGVLSEIISDRLRLRIREKIGASYSPYAYNKSSKGFPGYGIFQIIVETNPYDINSVIKEIKSLIKELINSGITEEELKRSLKPIMTGLKEMLRTNDYWLHKVMSGSYRHPQQLDWNRSIIKDYDSMNTKELFNYAKKYLNNEKISIAIVKPK